MLIFATDTTTAASAAALGQALQERIRDELIFHPAWELVEEFTPTGGLVNWMVFRNLATASGLSADWYLVVGRVLSSGRLDFFFCETYDSATKVAQHYGPQANSTTVTFDALGRFPGTYTLGTAVLTTSPSTVPRFSSWTPGATSIKWWMILDDDSFRMAWNGTPNHFIGYGAYIPLGGNSVPLPLVGHQLTTGGSGADGAVTRNIAVAGQANVRQLALGAYSGGSPSPNFTDGIGLVNADGRQTDRLQGNLRHSYELAVNSSNTQADYAVFGYLFGKQKPNRMRAFGLGGQSLSGIAWGDTFVLNGELWIQYLPTDNRIFNTGVLA